MDFSRKSAIAPSATVAINSLAQQKQKSGQRVYNLSAGEPIMNTAHYLEDAVVHAMHHGETLYPPVAGIDELRHDAAQWSNDLYKTNFTSKNTLVTCGGKFGIYLLLQALLNDGDEVIIVSPYWVSYPPMVELFGGRPVIITTQHSDGWKVRPEQIAAVANSKTKMLIFNNGSNPTGVLYQERELRDIVQVCKEKNILIMSDEVYSGLTYENEYISCGSFWEHSERILIIQSCSKNFAMTGWRVGFVFAPEEITKRLITLQGQSITGTSIISQHAATAALKNAGKITAEVCAEMQHRRDVFTKEFNTAFTHAHLVAPSSAFYSFIPLKSFGTWYDDDVKFCEKVLDEANVALVPGTAFGAPGFVRASFGAQPQELQEAVKVLAEYLKEPRK